MIEFWLAQGLQYAKGMPGGKRKAEKPRPPPGSEPIQNVLADFCWHANCSSIWRNMCQNDRVSPNLGTAANLNPAENLGSTADIDTVTQLGRII